jgi:SAM-dependent methyltransferase
MISTETTTTTSTTNPPHRHGTRDKSVGWYQQTLESITEPQRDLFENYSHIPPEKVIPHILEIVSRLLLFQEPALTTQRDRAWDIQPFPCIGQFRFFDLCLSRSPSYALILSRLQNGDSLLDLGCCFAQDLRKLVHDGAPSTNLYGAELKPEFMSLSYELFLDKDTFGAHFIQADIFDSEGALKELEDRMDVVQISFFLHLWDLEGQTRACEKIVGLLKQEKGVLVTGQQVGATEPRQMHPESGTRMYKHNPESFEKMWREVGIRTGSEWLVRAKLDAGLGIEEKKRTWDDPNTRRLVFEVERLR